MKNPSPMELRPSNEFVIATVSAVGTDQELFLSVLNDCLLQYRYVSQLIKVSSVLTTLDLGVIDTSNEYARIRTSMDVGNLVREKAGNGEVLALYAISKIIYERSQKPEDRRCFIIHSLKNPDEIELLRRVYGLNVLVVGLYSAEFHRREYLRQKSMTKQQTDELLQADQSEESDLGQQTRKTYQLADVFVDINKTRNQLFNDIERLLDLEFGHPYTTPSKDEYGMFMAFAASLRSSDLSRQVGASIMKETGELVALGCNDVPSPEGGLYWPGSLDKRDFKKECDSNHVRRDFIIDSIATKIREIATSVKDDAITQILRNSAIADITEYGRAVHAEMDAILACSRIGVAPVGTTLYTTTFPCHNCAKHIVASGIKEVQYIEPYPKSLAKELHGDSVVLADEDSNHEGRVVFKPFCGVGPRRYPQLFSMSWSMGYKVKRKDKSGKILPWDDRSQASPRIPLLDSSYLERENVAADIWMEVYEDGNHNSQEEEERREPAVLGANEEGRGGSEEIPGKQEAGDS